MILAIDDTLKLAASLFPPALVPPHTQRALVRLAGVLPPVASGGAVECRLGDDPRVDLLMYLLAEEGGPRAMLRRPAGENDPAWRAVRSFCEAWSCEGSPFQTWVPVLWLEFDVEGEDALPSPLPFPCVDRHLLDALPPGPQDSATREVCLQVIREAAALLLGRPLSAATEREMTRCIERLPLEGRALHVAPLATRGLDAVRVVSTLPVDVLPGYLDAIAWPGAKPPLEDLLASLFPRTGHVSCHLDVTARVEPVLGLEISYAPGDPRWEPVLGELCARGACSPEKAEALLRWPAEGVVALPHHRWPSRILGTVGIKLVLRPDEPLLAKAYLGFTERLWLPHGSARFA